MKMTFLLKKLLIALLGIGMLSVTVPVMASDEPSEDEIVVEAQDEQAADEEEIAVEGQEQEQDVEVDTEAEEAPAEKE